jgi:hypothetical protein
VRRLLDQSAASGADVHVEFPPYDWKLTDAALQEEGQSE